MIQGFHELAIWVNFFVYTLDDGRHAKDKALIAFDKGFHVGLQDLLADGVFVLVQVVQHQKKFIYLTTLVAKKQGVEVLYCEFDSTLHLAISSGGFDEGLRLRWALGNLLVLGFAFLEATHQVYCFYN